MSKTAKLQIEDIYPLSPIQQGMLFHDLYEPDLQVYAQQVACTLEGPLDPVALERAWSLIVERHQPLRTGFLWKRREEPVQIAYRGVALPWRAHDWSDLPGAEKQRRLAELLRADHARGFDLSAAPLMRLHLVRLEPETHQFVWTYHHMLMDGWSRSLVLQEVFAAYEALVHGLPPALPPAPPFSRYIAWLRAQKLDPAEGFWRGALSGFTHPTPLGVDHRPEETAEREGFGRLDDSLPAELSGALRETARRHQLTLSTLFQGAWALLLSAQAGQDGPRDVVFGATVSGRPAELAGVESMVGVMINTLPVRVEVPADGLLLPWLQELQVRSLELREFEHTPLVRIQEWSEVEPGRPLFESILVFENLPAQRRGREQAEGLRMASIRGAEATNYPLALMVTPGPEISLALLYDRGRFDDLAARRLLSRVRTALAAITAAASPEALLASLPLLAEAERHQVVTEWNDSARAVPLHGCRTVHGLFEMQADRIPDAPALLAGACRLTYGELEARANRLAHRLRALGVGPESLVGVALDRSAALVVAVLGVLKAGGGYVPLDPAYPRERLDYMLQASGAGWLVTGAEILPSLPLPEACCTVCLDEDGVLPGEWSAARPDLPVPWQAAAYVIFTSGSTGRPKGVQIPHGAVVNFLASMAERPGLRREDRLFAVTTLSFDIAGLELYLPLSVGAQVVLGRNAADGPRLMAELAATGATALQATPATWRLLLESGWQGTPGLRAFCGGEELPRGLAEALLERCSEVWNLYGPTETTIWSATHRVEPGAGVALGRPIANTAIRLLDSFLEPVPVGVAGELYIGGDGVARGYLGRPELTAERFVPDPLAAAPGERLYRTGDLARCRADGAIEYLGREDHQVKIRGYRIELGEIEETLRACSGVLQAVVVARPLGGEKRLVAYLVTSGGEPLPAGELRRALESRLPGYMIPTAFVTLSALPLTPNGKVAHKDLPEPGGTRAEGLVAARTPVEAKLAGLWRELLGVTGDGVSVDDSFFELGGHSLLAIRLMTRVRETFGVEVPLRRLLARPTLGAQAAVIAQVKAEQRAGAAGGAGKLPRLVPEPASWHLPFPLSEVQQAYWIGRQGSFDLGNVAAHGYSEVEVPDLDLERFQGALHRLIARHDMLRAVVHPDGLQQVLAGVPPYEVEVHDWRRLAAGEAEQRALGVRAAMSHQVRPADTWPLFDVRAGRLDGGRTRLFVSHDLLLTDAWSSRILLQELALLYEEPDALLLPLEMTFRDYVLAERELAATDLYRRAEEHWLGRLDTLPPAPDLPLACRPGSLREVRFGRRAARFGAAQWLRLKRRAAHAGITPAGILLAAYAEVLAVWSRAPRFTVNLTTFNRLPLHPQVDNVVGDFTSLTLLEVGHDAAQPFEIRARAVQERLWEDLEHRAFGGVRVLREMARLRGRSSGTLMPVVFTSLLFDTRRDEIEETPMPAGEAAWAYGISQTPQVWLDCQVSETAGALSVCWDAVEDLFPAGLLDDMFAAYRGLLERLANEPAAWERAEHPWLPAAHRALYDCVNATDAPLSGELLHTLFDAAARRDPARPAVFAPGRTLTFGELLARADALAWELRKRGAQPNRLVAVVMEKGWEQVVAVLGILKSGAAYLPLDAALPRERLRQLIARGECEQIVTQPWIDARVDWPAEVGRLVIDGKAPAGGGPGSPESVQATSDLAYVIFTSGSTGEPKGVMIDHRGVVNTVLDVNQRLEMGAGDRVLALSSLSFDLSVWDIFGTLAAGGAVVFPPAAAGRDPEAWADLVERYGVTVWSSVPALMEMLLVSAAGRPQVRLDSLRHVMLSGDWIPVHLPDQIHERCPGARVLSLGGATEASIWSILHPVGAVDPGQPSIPYGRPMRNQTFYVLDAALEPRPLWVPGELYIGGIGLAQGYWRDTEKTQARFIEAPWGEKLYRTGDWGRYLATGDIEFLGREDLQVKIQGHRIELGEIEAALESHPEVRSGVVVAVGAERGQRRLVGYVVPEPVPATAGDAAPAQGESIQLPWPLEPLAPPAVAPVGPVGPGSLHLPALGDLLACLLQIELPESPLPKYRYASAGNLYPVQVCLWAGPDRIEGLAAGAYSYDPREHSLLALAPGDAPGLADRPDLPEDAYCALFLVGEMKAVAPLYGALARDFSVLEAGSMGSLLATAAGERGLHIRELAAQGAGRLRRLFQLEPSHLPLWGLAVVPRPAGRPSAVPEDAPGEPIAAAVEAGSLPAPIDGELERLEFKLRQPGLRRLPGATAVRLPRQEAGAARLDLYRARRSHREYLGRPVPQEQLGGLLSTLARMEAGEARMPGPREALPWRLYLHIRPDGVSGLEPGMYAYDSARHRLVLLARGDLIGAGLHAAVNRPIHEQSRFTLFFVSRPDAGRDRGLLAAGFASQLLMECAPHHEIGLCPIGTFQFEPVARAAGLDSGDVLLYTLAGGGIRSLPGAAAETGVAVPARVVRDEEPRRDLAGRLELHLRERLPEYMVPARLVVLDALPLSANGKVDRGALAQRDVVAAEAGVPFVLPETETERLLANLWKEALQVEQAGVYDNFFDLGGNSLHMVRVHVRLQETLGREIRITDLFRYPTIHSLTEFLAGDAAPAQPAFEEASDRAGKYREAMRRQKQALRERSTPERKDSNA
ncbi:MAG TPA: amino acid adenylation domain-containing protein [Thermoanaerobaculia bacterium]|jgi:amino acid adenylation domain-containing protein|nr:amino acid adenylation domain-containing protein [Thermoanaerobaculia bacterium]